MSTGIVLERYNYDIFNLDQPSKEPEEEELLLPFQPDNILDIQPLPKYVTLPNK